jgi:hypothetical protein
MKLTMYVKTKTCSHLVSMLTADLLTGSESIYAICSTCTARAVKRTFRGRHTSRYFSILFWAEVN